MSKDITYLTRLGANEQRAFFSPNTGHVIRALKVQADPKYAEQLINFIHDAQLYSRFMEMDPLTVGRIMEMATADFLRSLGYDGARSNSGESLTPIYTVALRQIKKEFGEDSVYTNFELGFRGVKNIMSVKLRFITIMDEIVMKVLAAISAKV